MSGCRIGKISFKNGSTVHVLNNDQPSPLLSQARSIDACMQDAAGFMVLAWDDGLGYRLSYDIRNTAITAALLPEWIKTIISREVFEKDAVDAVEREFFM
jgi:hypothetical protein